MAVRDDFPADVIETIRKRAGSRCSVPTCRAATTGPSESRAGGVTNVGVAAHIAAAAPGGPRYDAGMTAEQRRSPLNGLWVCQTHGKAIDDDEHRYTAELLRAWCDRAEGLAREELGRPVVCMVQPGVVPHQRMITPGSERLGTADFIEDIAAPAAWGRRSSELVRMVLYELALNATTHGGASEVTLESKAGYVSLSYRGPRFGLSELLQSNQRGGGAAVRTLRETAAGSHDLNYRYRDEINEWLLVNHLRASVEDDPCGVSLGRKGDRGFAAVADCAEVHIYADDLWSFSDLHSLADSIPEDLRVRQFIVYGVDPDNPLAGELARLLPHAQLANPTEFL